MSLAQLIYISEIVPEAFPQDRPLSSEFHALLDRAQFRNQEVSVTGILLYNAGHFLQVLEGHPMVLNSMFRKIAADPRHKDVEQLALLSIDQRMFDKWYMGLLNLDDRLDLDHELFKRFVKNVKFALTNDAARASVISLLKEFREILDCEPQAV